VKNKKPRGRQNLFDNCQPYGIPAFAGMTIIEQTGLFTKPSILEEGKIYGGKYTSLLLGMSRKNSPRVGNYFFL
jgi:hypothetical protein